jgi:dTDP-4-dehydrorhamnose reductase
MMEELMARDYLVTMCSHNKAVETIANGGHDCVVNCHGYTGSPNVDACERDRKRVIEENSVFPIQLYEACKGKNIRIAHWSSGCIYQGVISSADQDANFFGSTYSMSKAVSDLYLKDKVIVFRIRLPFTREDNPKNLLWKIQNYARTGKLHDSGHNSITDLDEAVRVACNLLEENALGPHNLVNSGSITLTEVADLMNISADWYTKEEFETVIAAPRSNCVIPDTGRMRPVRDALIDAIAHARFLRPG